MSLDYTALVALESPIRASQHESSLNGLVRRFTAMASTTYDSDDDSTAANNHHKKCDALLMSILSVMNVNSVRGVRYDQEKNEIVKVYE
jgi:hypothetical protein